MAIALLSIPTRTGGTSTGYPADINAITSKINELAIVMSVTALSINAQVGAGNPAADTNTIVSKVNELVNVVNGTGGGGGQVATPANFVAAAVNATSIAYTWANASGATQVLQLSTTANFATVISGYTGPATQATVTGLDAQQTYYVRLKSQLSGQADSAYATRTDTTTALLNLNVIGTGDSLTAGPAQGTGNDPTHAPIVFATQRISSPTVSYVKLGFPSRTTRWFLDNQKPATLSAVAQGKRNILYHAFGANDIPLRTPSQRKADILEYANWALAQGNAFSGVLFVPPTPRLDTGSGGYGYALEEDGSHSDFRAAELDLIAYVANTIIPMSPKFKQAPINTSALYDAAAPNNAALYESVDKTHYTVAGSQDSGEQVIAPGLALFGDITLYAVNKAYQFNGADQNITVANPAAFKFEDNSAFSVLVVGTADGTQGHAFTMGSVNGTSRCWDVNVLPLSNGTLQAQIALLNGSNYVYSHADGISAGTHFFGFTYSGGQGEVYVDANPSFTAENSGGYAGMMQGGTFKIGQSQSGVKQSAGFKIDMLGIFNRKLSAGEMSEYYNGGNRRSFSGVSFISAAVALYEFDQSLADSSGNGHNGTATASVYV